VEFMADAFNQMKIRKGKKDVRDTPRSMAKLRKSAEKVKKVLSANKQYPITVESLCDDMDFRGTVITRDEFEEMAKDLFDRALTPVEQALDMANITIDQINQVEIIGGGVRIPKVQELLADFFKLDSVSDLGVHLNGDEAMALGAAFRAANMSKAFRVGRAERSVGMIESSFFPIGLRLEELPVAEVEAAEEGVMGSLAKMVGMDSSADSSDTADAGAAIAKKWSKRVSLFSRKSELLKKKKIKLTHDRDFTVTLKYDSHSKAPMDASIDAVFREFNITGLEKFANGEKKLLGTPTVELVFQLDSDGIPQITKAEAKLEEIVIVVEEEEKEEKEEEKVDKVEEDDKTTDAEKKDTKEEDGDDTKDAADDTGDKKADDTKEDDTKDKKEEDKEEEKQEEEKKQEDDKKEMLKRIPWKVLCLNCVVKSVTTKMNSPKYLLTTNVKRSWKIWKPWKNGCTRTVKTEVPMLRCQCTKTKEKK